VRLEQLEGATAALRDRGVLEAQVAALAQTKGDADEFRDMLASMGQVRGCCSVVGSVGMGIAGQTD